MKRLGRLLSGGELTGWKRRVYQATGLLLLLGIGGFAVSASGVMPIKASSGHWPITKWFLSFSMKRSVKTHSLGTKAPRLDDEMLVLKGAGHFDVGCAPCHGRPHHPQPRIAGAMTPRPPYLPPKVEKWDPEELFYITRHGVKFTGMPAFPSQQRDDEVWAVVAFMQRLPRLEAAEYHSLVGEESPGDDPAALDALSAEGLTRTARIVVENCGRCHGAAGLGRGRGAFPKLAGQRAEFFTASMKAYSRGERHSGIMEPIAAALDGNQWSQLADYFARLPIGARQSAEERDPEAIERGAAIAREGIPQKRIPACVDCHGPSEKPISPHHPKLSGQYAAYLVLQLDLFKKGHRGGTPYAHLMKPIAARLTSEQMRDVAAYYEAVGDDQKE